MQFTRKIRLDRIGSATSPARIGDIVEVSPEVTAEEGALIAVRALSESKTYGEIELPSGRPAKVVKGNLIAGVLGSRQALHGYMGHTPESLKAGDRISMLNMGGVMGICDAPNKDLGPPIALEVLGAIVREGEQLNIRDFGLPVADEIDPDGPPIVMIMGTSMNSGKTYAASEIIRIWSHSGVKVAAGKLTGVAALRDTLRMSDNGAIVTASFLDCGLPSTVESERLGEVARSVVAELDRHGPEVIILELGDGIIGGYKTHDVLRDKQVRARTRARVFCAGDLVGAWGGVTFLETFEQRPQLISGPVTDNEVGTQYIERELKIDAMNARLEPLELSRVVAKHAKLDKELFE
jgi:hypothetical protein